MKKRLPLNQKLEFVSLFQFFLWIFGLTFGMIFPSGDVFAQEKLYDVKNKRDPFVPLVASSGSRALGGGLVGVESIEEIQIESIVHDVNPKNSIVIANGSVLKEGDEVGSVRVLKIDPGGALFSVNGLDEYKPLYQEETKKGAGDKSG